MHGLRFKLLTVTFCVFALALSGCETHKQDSNVEAEGDSRLRQVDEQFEQLSERGLNLTPSGANAYEDGFLFVPTTELIRLKSDAQIQNYLEKYIDNIHRVLQLARHHGIKVEKSTLERYRRTATIARRYLDLIKD